MMILGLKSKVMLNEVEYVVTSIRKDGVTLTNVKDKNEHLVFPLKHIERMI